MKTGDEQEKSQNRKDIMENSSTMSVLKYIL